MNIRSVSVIVIAISFAILAGGYVVFRPELQPAPAVDVGPRSISLDISKASDGGATFRVKQGEMIRLQIKSTVEGALAIHGYHDDISLSTAQPVVIEFPADRSGRFSMDVHANDGAHLEAGVLQIEPSFPASQ